MDIRDLLGRISVDPSVCFGKPCIRGTRIWVSLILDLLGGGATESEILAEHPQLETDDIRGAGLRRTNERGSLRRIARFAMKLKLDEDLVGVN